MQLGNTKRKFKCKECDFTHPYWSGVQIHIVYKHSIREITDVFDKYIEVISDS